jgi:uncharacterized protein YhaN
MISSEHFDELVGLPGLTEILQILKDAEDLDKKSNDLKKKADDLRRKRKAQLVEQPPPLKKPYHYHEKHIEELVSSWTDNQYKGLMRMTRECFEELNDR